MRSAILSSIGGLFLLLAALCILAPSKISASPLALPDFGNGLVQRSAAAIGSAPIDLSRALQKRKSKSTKKKGISKGAIIGIVIAIVVVIIIVGIIFLIMKKKKKAAAVQAQ
jgi:hypothetical protein